MAIWEYTYIQWWWDLTGDPMAAGFPQMRTLGAAGWEMVSVTSTAFNTSGSSMSDRQHVRFTGSPRQMVIYSASFKREWDPAAPPAPLPPLAPPPNAAPPPGPDAPPPPPSPPAPPAAPPPG